MSAGVRAASGKSRPCDYCGKTVKLTNQQAPDMPKGVYSLQMAPHKCKGKPITPGLKHVLIAAMVGQLEHTLGLMDKGSIDWRTQDLAYATCIGTLQGMEHVGVTDEDVGGFRKLANEKRLDGNYGLPK